MASGDSRSGLAARPLNLEDHTIDASSQSHAKPKSMKEIILSSTDADKTFLVNYCRSNIGTLIQEHNFIGL